MLEVLESSAHAQEDQQKLSPVTPDSFRVYRVLRKCVIMEIKNFLFGFKGENNDLYDLAAQLKAQISAAAAAAGHMEENVSCP